MRGIIGVSSRPITRRLRQPNGFNAARGVEITVRFDERAFEGNGIMVLGAVLDRFFAEYAAINSFTETVIESQQRGEDQALAARPDRAGPAAMSYRDHDLPSRAPYMFDMFSRAARVRALDRPDKPRIGATASLPRRDRQPGPGPVPRISGVEPRQLRGFARAPQTCILDALPRLLRAAGRAAADDDRGGAMPGRQQRDEAFVRFTDIINQPLPAAVLPGLGRCAADRPGGPAGGRPLRRYLGA